MILANDDISTDQIIHWVILIFKQDFMISVVLNMYVKVVSWYIWDELWIIKNLT